MKILIICKIIPSTSDIPLMFNKAFNKIGHVSELISPDEDKNISEYLLTYSSRKSFVKSFSLFGKRVIKKLRSFRPQLILIYGSNFFLLPETINYIKNKFNCRIILWEGNNKIWQPHQSEALKYYDYIFCADSYLIPILKGPCKKEKVFFQASAADPEEHLKLELNFEDQKKYGADISIIGSGFPVRIDLFEELTQYDLKLWGRWWDRSEILKPYFIDEPVYGLKKVKIYNASKISINIQNPVTQINGISCRTFEILSCGGFPLTEYRKDLEKYFVLNKEVVAYYDTNDLKQKIDYYLQHSQERKKISSAGRKKILQEHNYIQRAREIIEKIG